MEGKVIDMRTRKALFNEPIRQRLVSAIDPHMASGSNAPEVVDTIEQVVCTELVAWARAVASRAAAKLADKWMSRE